MPKGSREVEAILKMRVPLIVRLGARSMRTEEVLRMAPGRIIELPQHFTDPLTVMINNKEIGQGEAVKVGENFGIRITEVDDRERRIHALKKSG